MVGNSSFGVFGLLLLPMLANASPTYTVAVLPSGPVYTSLNINGQVAGFSGNPVIATISGITAEPTPNGLTSVDLATINDNGLIGGAGSNSNTTNDEAFIGNTALGQNGTILGSDGFSLNNAGQLAGLADISGFGNEAFIATSSGGYQFLSETTQSAFLGINSAGVATGGLFDSTGSQETAIYGTTSGVTSIPSIAGFSQMQGNSINSAGNICGIAAGSTQQVFFFNLSASTASLIPLPTGFTGAQLNAAGACINDSNQVVFSALNGRSVGIIWDPVNGTQLLSNLVPPQWEISSALAIANNGDILAFGDDLGKPGGVSGFLLLSPSTPEPSSWTLVTIAAIGLISLKRAGQTNK